MGVTWNIVDASGQGPKLRLYKGLMIIRTVPSERWTDVRFAGTLVQRVQFRTNYADDILICECPIKDLVIDINLGIRNSAMETVRKDNRRRSMDTDTGIKNIGQE